MTVTPTISVVIPAFNRERFIATAIESVLSQTLAADQIIVVDDGSTDTTGDIARSYGPLVRVISIENNGAGPSRPRNVGIQTATSSHIMFLDSDDFLEPRAVERCNDVVRRWPDVGLVCTNYYTVNLGGETPHQRTRNEATTVRALRKREVGNREYWISRVDAQRALCTDWFIKTPASTVLKSVCMKVGGFDETFRTSNDYDFFCRVLTHTEMVYIDEALFTITFHTGNISAANIQWQFDDRMYNDHMRVLWRILSDPASETLHDVARGSVQKWLLDLAYEYRHEGQPGKAYRTYLRYLKEGGRLTNTISGLFKVPPSYMRWLWRHARRK
jgi:glycosyltransferase involved in cell wall biosynthesis